MYERCLDEIPRNVFTSIEEIGSGSFSDIFSAVHVNTNTKVALKITIKNANEEDNRTSKQEVVINKTLNHPFVCKYFFDFETEHLRVIVMELVEGCSALYKVNRTRGLPYDECVDLFEQLVISIEYLHDEAHITHRDLKLENIMIDKFNHIRLIDFGFSSVKTMMTTCCGSIPYCAPEILTGKKYTKAADIWSLGVILFAFVDGKLPFFHPNINTLANLICECEVKFTSNFVNDELMDLIKKMLVKDPVNRITIEEIKNHPFLEKQKLIHMDYKKLFKSSNELKSISKSSAFFNLLDNGLMNHNAVKEPSSSDEALCKLHFQKIHTQNDISTEADELIRSRKNFPLNLNKLIESALISFSSKNISLHSLNSADLSFRKNRRHFSKRSHHLFIFKNAAPLLQPNVINNKNLMDKK